jgi:predicted site-specific integrase-resolvase
MSLKPFNKVRDWYIDPAFAADSAGVCRESIYRYIRTGELPARRLGSRGRYKILARDFERFSGIQLEREAS